MPITTTAPIRRPLDEILQLLELFDDSRLSGIILRDGTFRIRGLIRQRRQTVTKTFELFSAVGRAGVNQWVVVVVGVLFVCGVAVRSDRIVRVVSHYCFVKRRKHTCVCVFFCEEDMIKMSDQNDALSSLLYIRVAIIESLAMMVFR